MIDKLKDIIKEYEDLMEQISSPDIMSDIKKYTALARQEKNLANIIPSAKEYIKKYNQLAEDEEILKGDDKELKELVKEEIVDLKADINNLSKDLKILLLPKDPNDNRNTILEIRSGTGGNEAALFAEDLFRMYLRYCENNKLKHETMSLNYNEGGGIKEVIFSIKGEGTFGFLKYESGVHRVQRVPSTETQGRVHTSAATVAILPEAEEVDVKINDSDLRIDVFRSSGPGGQSVNTTDSAVRVTHMPSGIVVTQQDEKSQHKNKAKALKILRARLYESERLKKEKERSSDRKSQIGSGDRSERIRTYNFPQGRVTDHRINLTLHKLSEFLNGEIHEEMNDNLRLKDQDLKLKALI